MGTKKNGLLALLGLGALAWWKYKNSSAEEKQAVKEPWGDKRPYPDAELAKGTVLERGGFAKEQEQQQEKGRSVKDIIKQAGHAAQEQEAQKQAEAAKSRPGIMAGPNKDIEEAGLTR